MNFLLFYGSEYYPSGGWHDFAGAYPTFEAAREQVKLDYYEWAHIVSITESKSHAVIVWSGFRGGNGKLQEESK